MGSARRQRWAFGSWFRWRFKMSFDGSGVGMDTFGAAAPAKKLFEHVGFTAANVAQVAAGLL